MNGTVEATFPRDLWLSRLVTQSLAEDVGSGDATTAVTAAGKLIQSEGALVARQDGWAAGRCWALPSPSFALGPEAAGGPMLRPLILPD